MKYPFPKQSTCLLLVAFAFCCLISGCATSSIASNKSDRLKGPYKRIFIVLRGNIRAAPFTGPWMDNISKEFQNRNISLKTYDIPDQDENSLSLNTRSVDEEINTQIKEFQPEVVMIVVLKKIERYAGVEIGRPGSNGGTFDIQLFEPLDSHTVIWRANLKVFGQYGISTAVKKGTDSFIEKLEQDGIIGQKSEAAGAALQTGN